MRDDRLSNNREIREKLSREGAGLCLHREGDREWYYDGEGHSMILGTTGSGKTSCMTKKLCRSILEKGEILGAVDPKGDLYRATAGFAKRRGYRVVCVNYRDVFRSDAYNPLASIYDDYHSGEEERTERACYMVRQLARSLIRESTKDPFWSDNAADTLCGLIFVLLEYGRRDQVNFASIFHMLNIGDRLQMIGEKVKTNLRWIIDSLPTDSLISMNLLSYVTTASETRGGIRSELIRMISMFVQSKGVIAQTSHDDLRIRDIDGTEKLAIYVTLPDESEVYDGLAGLLMNDLIVHYEGIAHNLYDGRLPIRVNFILEELANIGGAIPTLPKLLAAGRSRNIRVHYVLQSLDQLNGVYKDRAQSVINNTDITVMFRTNHVETLEMMSHLCGDREVVYADRVMREPLFKITDLAALPTGRALVRISGQVQYTEDFPFFEEEKEERDPESDLKRTRPIAEPFDLRPIAEELVRKDNRKKEGGDEEEE